MVPIAFGMVFDTFKALERFSMVNLSGHICCFLTCTLLCFRLVYQPNYKQIFADCSFTLLTLNKVLFLECLSLHQDSAQLSLFLNTDKVSGYLFRIRKAFKCLYFKHLKLLKCSFLFLHCAYFILTQSVREGIHVLSRYIQTSHAWHQICSFPICE